MADLKDFVGKRILVKKGGSEDLFETEIAEVSPSGKFMRVGDSEETAWIEAEDYDVVEELAPVELSEENKAEMEGEE